MLVLLVVHFATSCMMVGIIWFVQIVHYPLFTRVGADRFQEYETRNTYLTTWVVAPTMLVEAISAGILCLFASSVSGQSIWYASVACLIVVWTSTFLIQVPLHEELTRNYTSIAHRKLVATNWLRTLGWTLRAILVAILLCR